MIMVLRRTVVVFGAAGVAAAVIRLRGRQEAPPPDRSWRELTGPDLR